MLARQADCVQFATPALEAQFAALNPRRAVFPSQLWDAPPPLPLRRLDRVVIGWGGSRAHREDLRAVDPGARRRPRAPPRGARRGHERAGAARRCSTRSPPSRVSFAPWGPLDDYYRFLENVDIGIAPLAADPVQPLPRRHPLHRIRRPRRAGGVRRSRALPRRACDPDRPGTCFATWPSSRPCSNGRSPRGRCGRRSPPAPPATSAASGSSAATSPRGSGSTCPSPPRSGSTLRGRRRAGLPSARRAPTGDARPHLPGLALRRARRRRGRSGCSPRASPTRRAGATDEARRCFAAAGRLRAARATCPPLLLGSGRGARGGGRGAHPRRGAQPRAPARHPTCAACACSSSATAPTRPPAFERARAIAPGFGAPQERLGGLAEAAGPHRRGLPSVRGGGAAERRPSPCPIARLAAIAQRDGQIDKAVGLLERSLGDDPDLSLTNFLVGRAYVELRRYHQARVHLLRAARRRRGPRRRARPSSPRPRSASATWTPRATRSRKPEEARINNTGTLRGFLRPPAKSSDRRSPSSLTRSTTQEPYRVPATSRR